MKKQILSYIMIVAGVTLVSFGLDSFLIPNKIAAGGVSGIATIVYYLIGFPVGTTMLIINIPLFILGGKIVGKHFFIKTLFATVLLSALIDFVDMPIITDDIMLATVYGGCIIGAGLGIVIYAESTTGGTDMAAKILNKLIPKISVANFLFIIDLSVILIAGFVFDIRFALYAVVSIYISTKVIELILQGYKNGKAYLIISDAAALIKQDIIQELDRGVTVIKAVGGYTEQEKIILFCVIRRNAEVIQLKQIVKSHDKNAFVIATHVTEVLGEGFATHE